MKFQEYIENNKIFKLILGAGNENMVQIAKMIELYYRANCVFFDLAANETIIDMAKKIAKNAYLCASFCAKGDQHLKKAQIDFKKCKMCGRCKSICAQDALWNNSQNCIGCKICESVCANNAINFYEPTYNFDETLDKIIAQGIDCIELHAKNSDIEDAKYKWNTILKKFDGYVSLCVGKDEIELARELTSKSPYERTIIQADGKSMSGLDDKEKTSEPAIECAKLYAKENLSKFLFISGGTNSKTQALLQKNSIKYDGITFGTYARKIKDIDCAKTLVESVSLGVKA